MSRVLVIGGAGYVGSATCAHLIDRGHDVWVLDDLSTGHREIVAALEGALPGLRGFTQARAGDREAVGQLLRAERIECVMHFAAKALVAESVREPELYFENNVRQTEALIEAMIAAGVRRLVFSSTCAVFGTPSSPGPMGEDLPKEPINPYGESKLAAEQALERAASRHGLRAIALRYFNAAGAEPRARVGEWHDDETHLIPNLMKAALGGRPFDLFGTDYPTPDGTAVRDYVHVSDLARAHESAMAQLLGEGDGYFEAFNIGSGQGYSVRQLLDAVERFTGRKLVVREQPRRDGDPPTLVADSTRAQESLEFKVGMAARAATPAGQDAVLDGILLTAMQWERRRSGELRPAVFLDRDGTINEDPGYLSDPAQMKLCPGVGEALATLARAGYALVVVSNQSGVGRGLFDVATLTRIHQRLDALLAPTRIDRYELCIHRPEDGCACRKPHPKLLVDAALELGVDLARSYMIGDKRTDVEAGRNAGCAASILVRTGEGQAASATLREGSGPGTADLIVPSLTEAVAWITSRTTPKIATL